MPGSVALFVWFVLLVGLIRFDPARIRGTSLALWLPVISFLILTSRLPSQWLGLVNVGSGYAQVLEEGNSLDRSIYLLLILVSGVILLRRSFAWSQFLTRNLALVAFLSFALLSIIWSEYAFIAFKRWIRDLAQYMTLLVVLSDPRPLDAVRTVFRRACYILLPLSIVLIKYFSYIGRQYDVWTGQPMYVGATTSKNMLGVLCLFSVLLFVWDSLDRWRSRHEATTKRILWLNVAFLAMTLWLLNKANSATSSVCLLVGLLVLLTAHLQSIRRRPAVLLAVLPLVVTGYATLFAFGIDVNAWIASLVGRDPTLTGRTLIWEILLGMSTNAWVGAGYESFWMGPRLQAIWARAGLINQAHNGYLQVYLNLGLVGVALLVLFLVVSYRNICREFRRGSSLARVGLAVWTVLLFYNVSEAAFPAGPLWLLMLCAALRVPAAAEAPNPLLQPQARRSRDGIRVPAGAQHSAAPVSTRTAWAAQPVARRTPQTGATALPMRPRFHTRRQRP